MKVWNSSKLYVSDCTGWTSATFRPSARSPKLRRNYASFRMLPLPRCNHVPGDTAAEWPSFQNHGFPVESIPHGHLQSNLGGGMVMIVVVRNNLASSPPHNHFLRRNCNLRATSPSLNCSASRPARSWGDCYMCSPRIKDSTDLQREGQRHPQPAQQPRAHLAFKVGRQHRHEAAAGTRVRGPRARIAGVALPEAWHEAESRIPEPQDLRSAPRSETSFQASG